MRASETGAVVDQVDDIALEPEMRDVIGYWLGCDPRADQEAMRERRRLRCVVLWPGPGLEDRPSNFGPPQRLVSGLGGADEVVLTNRPVDGERMLSHVVGEGPVRSVDFGV